MIGVFKNGKLKIIEDSDFNYLEYDDYFRIYDDFNEYDVLKNLNITNIIDTIKFNNFEIAELSEVSDELESKIDSDEIDINRPAIKKQVKRFKASIKYYENNNRYLNLKLRNNLINVRYVLDFKKTKIV